MEGFALTSLLEVVGAVDLAPAPQDEPTPKKQPQPQPQPALEQPVHGTLPRTINVQIFAGGECAGDLRESALLEKAIGASQRSVGASPVLRCTRTVVPGSDHAVAAAMKASGQLHDVLCSHCL